MGPRLVAAVRGDIDNGYCVAAAAEAEAGHWPGPVPLGLRCPQSGSTRSGSRCQESSLLSVDNMSLCV